MIEHLKIKNFKSHQNSEFKIGAFNLFAGKNGMGKSTILQSLLLLRQSYQLEKNIDGALLNGDLIRIGNSQDALCVSADGDFLELSFTESGAEYQWQFQHNPDSNFMPTRKKIEPGNLIDLPIFGVNFQYIAAEHQAAKHVQERNTYYVTQLNQISERFGDGKYTVHYLAQHSGDKLQFDVLANESEPIFRLANQVDAWLREISPGVSLNILESSSQDTLLLRYNYRTKAGSSRDFKPENVGFGVSYVLPILVATLSAKAGSIILLENPESHLHPAGQASLAKLLCRAASCGVQFFIETHSEHFINAVIISCKENIKDSSKGISREKVSIYFVDRKEDTVISENIPVVINEYGVISKPPVDFFDQLDKDLEAILAQ